ncbi:MAG: EVE domain-containing protein [Armatimonadetes bacterium]|nr:EVE domain-containing protein [Armatimonadota bacterium]
MNKRMMLTWLWEDTEAAGAELAASAGELSLDEMLLEANSRRPVEVPRLPAERQAAEVSVRRYFNDNVTLASLVLHHHYPKDYLFYRVSTLEPEIFEAFASFAEVLPMLDLPFDRVGRAGFDRYLHLNVALRDLARFCWPDLEDPQWRLSSLLYDGFGTLFATPSGYNRYWLMVTDCEHESIDRGEDVTWSARKDAQTGDLVFMYRTAPVSAIVGLYRIASPVWFQPWGPWDGFWADLSPLAALKPVPFPVIAAWAPVRRNLQGVMTEPITHKVYNKLLRFIPKNVQAHLGLEPEPDPDHPGSGAYATEAEFEEAVVEPLLRRWEFRFETQSPCRFRTGTSTYAGRVDFVVRDGRGPLTLFENKLRIADAADLDSATQQGRSYALMLGLPSFVVASPEGLWLYRFNRHEPVLVRQVDIEKLGTEHEALRSEILRLRDAALHGS